MSSFRRGYNQKQQGGRGQRLNNNDKKVLASNETSFMNTISDPRAINRCNNNNNNSNDGSTNNKNSSSESDHTLRQSKDIYKITVHKKTPKEQGRHQRRKQERPGSRPRPVFNVDGIRVVAPPEVQAKRIATTRVNDIITTTTASASPQTLPTVMTIQDPKMNLVLNRSSNKTKMAMVATTMAITSDIPRDEDNLSTSFPSSASHEADSKFSASSTTRYKRWTKEEDDTLRSAIAQDGKYKIYWQEIAGKYFNTTRSVRQCKSRWMNHLQPRVIHGNWNPDEDRLVQTMVLDGFGWREIAHQLPGRVREAIRERYVDFLDPRLKKAEWTKEEDDILFQTQRSIGNKWTEIRKLLPGRSENSIKNRHHNRKRGHNRKNIRSNKNSISSNVDVDEIGNHLEMTALVSSELKKFHNASATATTTTTTTGGFQGRVEDHLNSSNVLSSNGTDESSDNNNYQDSTSSSTILKSRIQPRATKKRKTKCNISSSSNNGNQDNCKRKRSSQEQSWNNNLLKLTDYKREFKHTNVPNQYTKNKSLGIWVSTQRKQYKHIEEGTPSFLTKERISSLNKLGFEWKIRYTWDERLQQLVDFNNKFNHINVPRNYTTNRSLGSWVSTQRKEYKHIEEGKPSSLTKEGVESLNKLGFVWRLNKRTQKATASVVSSTAMSQLLSSSKGDDPNGNSNATSTPRNNNPVDVSSTSSTSLLLDEEEETVSVADIGGTSIAVKGDIDCYESDDSELYLTI